MQFGNIGKRLMSTVAKSNIFSNICSQRKGKEWQKAHFNDTWIGWCGVCYVWCFLMPKCLHGKGESIWELSSASILHKYNVWYCCKEHKFRRLPQDKANIYDVNILVRLLRKSAELVWKVLEGRPWNMVNGQQGECMVSKKKDVVRLDCV